VKYLMTYAGLPDAPPPSPETLARLGAYTARMLASGKVVLTGGLVRPTRGIQLRYEGGQVSVTDGPFAETKELIDGFALVEVGSEAEALELAREFMGVAGDGHGEILRVYEGGPQ
jgi:hypothetical protein